MPVISFSEFINEQNINEETDSEIFDTIIDYLVPDKIVPLSKIIPLGKNAINIMNTILKNSTFQHMFKTTGNTITFVGTESDKEKLVSKKSTFVKGATSTKKTVSKPSSSTTKTQVKEPETSKEPEHEKIPHFTIQRSVKPSQASDIESKPSYKGYETLTESEFNVELKKNCSQALNNKKMFLTRGIETDKPYMKYVGGFYRNSDDGYVNAIIDSSKEWSQYPKRCYSLMGIADKTEDDSVPSSVYGNLYRIYPFDNSNIAVASSGDFWYTFDATLKGLAVSTVNAIIADILRWKNKEISAKNVTEFKGVLAKLTPYELKSLVDTVFEGEPNINNLFFKSCIKNPSINFISNFESLLTPKNGKCYLVSTNGTIKASTKEFWTQGNCLLQNIQTTS